jgi:5-hydroxyisourate hydrolase-like protein (transthyretin family)
VVPPAGGEVNQGSSGAVTGSSLRVKVGKVRSNVTVSVYPKSKNRPVMLQRLSGSAWKTVKVKRTNSVGKVKFTKLKKKVTYRAYVSVLAVQSNVAVGEYASKSFKRK